MLQISILNKIDKEDGLPEWLQYATKWFVQENNNSIMLCMLKKPDAKNWVTLGRILLDEIILCNEYGWIYIDGEFQTLKLLSWLKELSNKTINNLPTIVNFSSYSIPHYTIKNKVVNNNEWLSLIKSNVYPLARDFFSELSSQDLLNADILIASPRPSLDVFSNNSFYYRNNESVFKYMGSWIYPIEEYAGYVIGFLSEHPSSERLKEIALFNRLLFNKLNQYKFEKDKR